jgi:hypothetical protein
MVEPQEPPCPAGRKPHRERVKQIHDMLPTDKTGAVCIDDTEEHRAWYLHEIAKYPRLVIVDQGPMKQGIYIIKIRKLPSMN